MNPVAIVCTKCMGWTHKSCLNECFCIFLAPTCSPGTILLIFAQCPVVLLPILPFLFTSNMSSMEQGLIPSVCLKEAAAPQKEGEELPSEILESIKELSKVLEEDENKLISDDEDDDAEQSEYFISIQVDT